MEGYNDVPKTLILESEFLCRVRSSNVGHGFLSIHILPFTCYVSKSNIEY